MVSGRRPSWHAKAACIGSSVAFFSEKPDDVTAARARYPVLRGSKTA